MTTEGWILMVGLRVFDVGGLIIWLIWFFKLRDHDSDEPGEPDEGGGDFRYRWGPDPDDPGPLPAAGPPDLVLPRPDAESWPSRRRDHDGDRAPATLPSRPYRPHRVPERRTPARRG